MRLNLCIIVSLTNQVQSPYCKLHGPSFSPWFMAQVQSMQVINQREKTRICNLQYGPRKWGTIFIVSLGLIRCVGKEISWSQVDSQLPQVLNFAHMELLWVFQFFRCSVTNFLSFKIFFKRYDGKKMSIKLLNLAGCTVEYGLKNWPITVHVLTERQITKWLILAFVKKNR